MKNYQIVLLSLAVCFLTVFVQGDLMVSQVTSDEEEKALEERKESAESTLDSVRFALENMGASHAEVLKDMTKMLEALDRHLGPSIVDLSNEITTNALNVVNRGMLGVEFGDVTDDGIVIEDVFEGFPAQEAGMEAGDVLVELEGVTVKDFNDPIDSVIALISNRVPGSEANLTILRDGTKIEKSIELVSRARLQTYSLNAPGVDSYSYTISAPIGRDISIDNWLTGNNAYVMGTNRGSIGIMEIEEDLGHYFGVEYGVLILTIPEIDDFNSYDPQLEVGDVILEIHGNPIRSASHVYKHTKDLVGEFEVVVKRKKREKTLTVDAEELRFRPVLGIN